ncbi:MAG TPA: DUF4349 domain-containing protein [Acidobacteriota bacterium]|nr:DUF4349 domain-containing protein [Acidobacteriota bacterium]
MDDIEGSKRRISRLVEEAKGYVTSLEESGNRTRVQSSFTIRVPAAGFDALVENILKEGIHVGNIRIDRKDVTEEFLDLTARMETQKALEIRYREILRQARNVEEILKVEQALGALREEIEAKEGRIRYLSHQTEYSTIYARAYQNLPYSPPPPGVRQSFIGRLTSSLVNGWTELVDFVFDLLSIWPLVIVFCGIVYSIRKWIKRRNKKRASSQEGE